jgi:hypothetical protein
MRRKNKQKEVSICTGTLINELPLSILDTCEYNSGKQVTISNVVNTPVGRLYKIIDTIKWVNETDLSIDKEFLQDEEFCKLLESLPKPKKIENEFTNSGKLVIKNSVSHIGTQGNITSTKKRNKRKKMDKQELKSVLGSLNEGDKVTFNFVGDLSNVSGVYTVLGSRKGRGKGGSMLVDLQSEDGKSKLTTGTPDSDKILNVVLPDGTRKGYEREEDLPKVFETNAARATELKTQMKDMVTGTRVRLESTESDFAGEFTVAEVKQIRGRFGQVVVTLENDDGATKEFWTYRHSGIVTSVEVVE